MRETGEGEEREGERGRRREETSKLLRSRMGMSLKQTSKQGEAVKVKTVAAAAKSGAPVTTGMLILFVSFNESSHFKACLRERILP